MAAQERSELAEKLQSWYTEVNAYNSTNVRDPAKTDAVLTKGYQLFFSIIEPFKKTLWIRSEHPNPGNGVCINPKLNNPQLVEFADLFRNLYEEDDGSPCWNIQIYGYRTNQSIISSEHASLTIENLGIQPEAQKTIRMFFSPSRDLESMMKIQETTTSWIREGTNAVIETPNIRQLHNYSGLEVCKLVVASADTFHRIKKGL